MQARLVTIVFIAAAAVVLLLVGTTVWLARESARANLYVSHTQEVLHAIDQVRAHFNRTLAAHRALLLSSAVPAARDLYQAERGRRAVKLMESLRELRELTTDNDAQQQRVETLEALTRAQRESFAAQESRQRAGMPLDLLPEHTTSLRWYELFDALVDEESRLLAQRRALEDARGQQVQLLFVLLAVLLLALLALAWWRQRAELRAREQLLSMTSAMEKRQPTPATRTPWLPPQTLPLRGAAGAGRGALRCFSHTR